MLKILSSVRITVVCLFLLFVLTFWGTVAQVQQGLYVAQERFFNSFFFLAAGFIPFPGAQSVLWVLFINLICMLITRYSIYKKWSYAGVLIIHFGLLLYFSAAFIVFQVSKESAIRLTEGQTTNVSTSYFKWELAYWTGEGAERQVTAIDTDSFKPGYEIPLNHSDFTLKVKQYYPNSEAFNSSQKSSKIINSSGISLLTPKPLLKEKEQNVAGGVFDIRIKDKSSTLILYGAESGPTPVTIGNKVYYFIMRHKHYALPFSIRLDQFKVEFHPGTDTAKSYESFVTITTGSLQRQVRIYMNNPLRYKDYTLYQASYDIDNTGRQYSTLAVVKNFAAFLPYVACFAVFLGLVIQFLTQAFSLRSEE